MDSTDVVERKLVSDSMVDELSAMRRVAGFKSQNVVGELLGVAGVTVSRWETGARAPSIRNIQQLARLYRVSEGDIVKAVALAKKCREGST